MQQNQLPAAPAIAVALTDPDTYSLSPHHADVSSLGPIELHETLISYVALAGSLAYKVKKPVHYEFVDYATLDKRRAACLEELDLNRRWAPELYLGLSSLVRSGAGLRFDAAGEPVEYAVRMQRFSPDDELAALLERRAVTAAELAAFGTFVADQHERAPTPGQGRAPAGGAFELAERNLNDLQAIHAGDALDLLRDWTHRMRPTLEGPLTRRRAAGRVRECHGDLHCGNVVRIGRRLLPFDGIDFDPALRYIDAASDVAFLVMDLELRARPDLATAFLGAWLQRSGDYDAGSCLRFFLVYRALVRAKVALLRAHQGDGSAAGSGLAEAGRYVGLAMRYTQPRCGALVLMHGPSGSGKSVLAEMLAPALGAICIRADVERDRLMPREPPNSGPPGADRYAAAAVRRVYAALAESAHLMMAAGCNVIVDATFLDADRRAEFTALARELHAPVAVVACEAPADLLRSRIAARRNDPSEATIAVLERQLLTTMPLRDEERRGVVAVRTDEFVDTSGVARAIERILGTRLCGLDGSAVSNQTSAEARGSAAGTARTPL